MTARSYGFTSGIHVRGLLLALALHCLSLSAGAAVNGGSAPRANYTQNGNSASIGPLTNSGGSTIPVSPTIGGWTQAGNYGVPPSAMPGGTMNLTVKGDVVFSGTKYPFQAGYGTPWKDLAKNALTAGATLGCSLAGGGLTTAACALTLPIAVPYIWDWVSKAGGRINPTTGQFERRDDAGSTVSAGYEWRGHATSAWSFTREAACVVEAARATAAEINWTYTFKRLEGVSPDGVCYFKYQRISDGVIAGYEPYAGLLKRASATCPAGWIITAAGCAASAPWLPSSMDDIAPYMGNINPDSRVVGEILSKGGEIPLGTPTVTGPSSIQGPETTKQNGDGTKEVSRTTYNFSTAGNTITNTSNVTTTNNYNAAGAVTNTTTTTTTPTPETSASPGASTQEPPPTQCEKFPNSLGCAELDTPTEEIPKTTKTITFTEENPFGGGACPANVMTNLQTLGGQSVKLVDWQTFCGMALPLRGLVIALASIMAFFIIMPGGVRE